MRDTALINLNPNIAGSTAVLVLGMHRAGTSCVAGVIHHMGVAVGNRLIAAGPENSKGFFEQEPVVKIHDEILELLGSAWDDPLTLPSGWQNRPEILVARCRLAGLIAATFSGENLWLVKDPRLCRLLPLWLDMLDAMDVSVKILLVLREPAEVAASLAARNAMPAEQSAMLWLSHYLAAERQSRAYQRCFVTYTDCLTDWRGEMALVALALDIAWGCPAPALAARIDAFIDHDLRHHNAPAQAILQTPQNSSPYKVYAAMRTFTPTPHNAHPMRVDNAATAAGICDAAAAALAEAEGAALPVLQYMASRARRQQAKLLRRVHSTLSWRLTKPLRLLAGISDAAVAQARSGMKWLKLLPGVAERYRHRIAHQKTPGAGL